LQAISPALQGECEHTDKSQFTIQKGENMQASRVKRNDNIISIFCTALSVWLLAVAAFFAAREGLSTVLRGFADILFSKHPFGREILS
jgi:hypothetical protein